MTCLCYSQGYADGQYVLPPLPYGEASLEPLLDAETLALHHDRHHAAYVAGANRAAALLGDIARGERDAALAPAATSDLAFNLGGHILHCLYWRNMSPSPKSVPEGALSLAIEDAFGSFENMLGVFRTVAAGVQGSGWAVLGVDPVSRMPRIFGIRNHQDCFVPGFVPLMVCDVWEHAYYLRYHNNRGGYIGAFLELADWGIAEKRFEHHICHCRHE